MIDIWEHVEKLNTRAFMLNTEKVNQFMQGNSGSKKVIDRFYAHKPKDGVVTPLK